MLACPAVSAFTAIQALDWRLKSRLKTHAAALVICLNIAVDPPDIVKTKPCAKLECWVDPGNLRPEKARECRVRSNSLDGLS